MMPAPLPLPDPQTMIAAVSAVLQAIQTWIAYRDKTASSRSFDQAFSEAHTDPKVAAEGATLSNLVPSDILGTMTGRVETCWKHFRIIIAPNSAYVDPEVDEQVEAVKRCICRELRRLYRLNRSIPPGKLSDWWNAYCAAEK
jgi:hypothetical protein